MKKPLELRLVQGDDIIVFNLDLDERKDRNFVELTEEFAYKSGITVIRIPDECQEKEDE